MSSIFQIQILLPFLSFSIYFINWIVHQQAFIKCSRKADNMVTSQPPKTTSKCPLARVPVVSAESDTTELLCRRAD